MKEYCINELNGESYICAINNIINELHNIGIEKRYSDYKELENFAFNASMCFDCNGEFIR